MSDTIPQDTPAKQCVKCKAWLPATAAFFPTKKQFPDQFRSRCKKCTGMGTRPPREVLPDGCKRCAKCKEIKPTTSLYFNKDHTRKNGLYPYCKECEKNKWLEKHPPKEEPVPEGYKRCGNMNCRKVYPATTEYFHRNKRKVDGLNNDCKTCHNKRGKEYSMRPEIRAHRLERQQIWNDIHKDYHKTYYAVYNQINAERERIRAQRYRARHLEHMRHQAKAYYYAIRKAYFCTEEGKLARRAITHRRRTRKENTPGDYTPEQIQEQLKRQEHKCYYCHKKFECKTGVYVYHIEHTIPLSRIEAQPRNSIDHIVLACPHCNLSKNDKLPHEWFEGGRLM